MNRVLLMALITSWGLASAPAAEADRHAADQAAIRQAVDSYVTAFNQGDAKALAALWSPEAVYTDPFSGQQAVGRAAIEQQFAAQFAGATGAKLEATTNSIRFISPSVAVEDGAARVLRPEQPADESKYTAIYVKQDGQWLLDRVTEEDVPVVQTHYEQLKELEWMIGDWSDQDEQSRVETSCQWTKNRNFITRWFTASVRDRIEMAGLQIIGWDAAAGQIRSWVFDSEGGFGEGLWTKKNNAWYIHTKGTLPDGRSSSAVNVITYVDDDTFTWQSVNREAGGQLLPNVDEVVVVRQPAAAGD